jgi:serine O-acetyltransferase
MFETLRADFAAATGDRTLEKGLLRILLRVETGPLLCYRFSRWVHSLRVPVIRQLLMVPALFWQRFNQTFMGIFISPDADIGPGLVLHTPTSIYVAPVKIGANCTLSMGTLINSGVRSVGDNVYFGAGCKIVGPVKIGNNVVVAANSLVITDVRDNTTIMGVPARIKLPGGKAKRFAWGGGLAGQKDVPAGTPASKDTGNGNGNSSHSASPAQEPGIEATSRQKL